MPNQTTASPDCAGCNKPLPKSEYLRCNTCYAAYDLDCINMSTQRFTSFYKLDKKRRESWKCPECVCKKPKSGNQNTPIRPILLSPEQTNNVTQRCKSTPKDFSDNSGDDNSEEGLKEVTEGTVSEFKKICEELRAMRSEMSMFRSAISELTAAIKTQNSRLDSLENRIETLEARRAGVNDGNVSDLEAKIAQLELEIDERDQEMLGSDIEIAGFPETANENSTHVILTIAKKLGMPLDERDVVSAERVGAPRPAGAPAGGAGAVVRPRPIAVRLVRRSQRDALLQAARVRRHLTTDDAYMPGVSPSPRLFYINERLTRRNRRLFQKTREAAKRLNWKYVWTRDGKVFVRQESGKARHRIRADNDLVRVFGDVAVSDDKPLC